MDITGEAKIGTLAPARPSYLEPTVGRIVHYQSFKSPEPVAAIITSVREDQVVDLVAFQPNGDTIPHRFIAYSETPEEGYWNWPPRS